MTMKSVLTRLLPGELFNKQRNTTHPSPLTSRRYSQKSSPQMVHGTAGIINGKVVISDPKNDGSYATMIVPGQTMVKVYLNGTQVYGEVVLSQSDHVKVELIDVKPSIEHKIEMSDDKLTVVAQIEVNRGISLTLKDRPLSRQLKFEFDKKYTYPQSSTPEMIRKLLTKSGYIRIDHQAVNRLCQSTEGHKEIVVRGIKPQHGREASLRTAVNYCVERDHVFRTTRCGCVQTGTTIAVVEPEIKGAAGRDVFNVPIPPVLKDKKNPQQLGNGVANVNGDIVAIRDGRIKYSKHVVDVIPELKFERDISGDDGEIVFDGNIVVYGSIRDKAVIKAQGTVTIYGSIEQASVFSNEGILVQESIYHSTIVAGQHRLIYQDLSILLDKMIPELTRFADEYADLVEYAMSRVETIHKVTDIPAILFQNRHTELGKMLDIFVEKYSNELSTFDPEDDLIKQMLDLTWSGNNRFGVSQRDAQLLLEKLVLYKELIKLRTKDPSVVRVYDVASSTIRCAGNILILGSSDASTLESENRIAIFQNLRGGFAVAQKSIHAKEVGTPSGVETSIRVNDPVGHVRIQLNHKNTLVEIRGNRYRSHDAERNLRLGGSER